MKTPDSLGRRLRVLRAEHDFSQLDVCDASGLKPTRYWRIEQNRAIPRPAELKALARVLRTTVAHLTGAEPV